MLQSKPHSAIAVDLTAALAAVEFTMSSPPSSAADQDNIATSPPPPSPFSDDHRRHYFIELYFDAALENQVLKSWNALSRRHISSRLIHLSSRPHLTLLPLNSAISSIQSTLRSIAARFSPLPLSFSIAAAAAANPNPNTNDLFFVPNPTISLLNFHSNICDALRRELGDGLVIPDEYRPDTWLPLCPAALDVPHARVAEALGLLQELLRSNVGGFGMEIALVERSPDVRDVFSVAIGSSGGSSADG